MAEDSSFGGTPVVVGTEGAAVTSRNQAVEVSVLVYARLTRSKMT